MTKKEKNHVRNFQKKRINSVSNSEMNNLKRLGEKISNSPLGSNVLVEIIGKQETTDNYFFNKDEGTNMLISFLDGSRIFLSIHNQILSEFDNGTISKAAIMTCEEYFKTFPQNEFNYAYIINSDYSTELINEFPRPKGRGIEDFTLRALFLWGNKSPTPPVLIALKGGELNPKRLKRLRKL